MATWFKHLSATFKIISGTVVAIFMAGVTMTYKAIAYQKEFKAEILEEVTAMRSQDMTLINERLNNIDKNVGDTKSDVRMIKQHLMDRR
jgi:hypothetical protein